MARCTGTRDLEVHHKRRDGGNDIGNAEFSAGPAIRQQQRTARLVNRRRPFSGCEGSGDKSRGQQM